MGMGEPFDNYYEVVKFIRLINDKRSFNVSLRNISLSTCGLVDKIKLFVREQLPVNLCISLHASDDNKRKKIMPISKKWNIHEIIDAAHYYFNETGRRIIIEYIVIKNFNDSVDDVENLCNILKNINFHINLIPLNAVDGYAFESPSKKDVYRFASLLNSKGLSATVRLSQGVDILGACGQLRGSILSDG